MSWAFGNLNAGDTSPMKPPSFILPKHFHQIGPNHQIYEPIIGAIIQTTTEALSVSLFSTSYGTMGLPQVVDAGAKMRSDSQYLEGTTFMAQSSDT